MLESDHSEVINSIGNKSLHRDNLKSDTTGPHVCNIDTRICKLLFVQERKTLFVRIIIPRGLQSIRVQPWSIIRNFVFVLYLPMFD